MTEDDSFKFLTSRYYFAWNCSSWPYFNIFIVFDGLETSKMHINTLVVTLFQWTLKPCNITLIKKKSRLFFMSKILISEPILTLRWSKRGFKGSRKWLDYSNINKISYFQKYGIPQKAKNRETTAKFKNLARCVPDMPG